MKKTKEVANKVLKKKAETGQEKEKVSRII